jgi:hypothetical protein
MVTAAFFFPNTHPSHDVKLFLISNNVPLKFSSRASRSLHYHPLIKSSARPAKGFSYQTEKLHEVVAAEDACRELNEKAAHILACSLASCQHDEKSE